MIPMLKEVIIKSNIYVSHVHSEEQLDVFLQTDKNNQILKEIESEQDFSCGKIYQLLSLICDYFHVPYYKEDAMAVMYQYAISKSFPRAVTQEIEEVYIGSAQLYLMLLEGFNQIQKQSSDGTFQSTYPFNLLTDDEIGELEEPTEYMRFKEHFEQEYVYEMMKLNLEVTGRGAIDHITGVHYLALHIGRQLKKKGLNVDLGRVSGAAAGHDIGKFGCRPEEMKRIAYYHYYYTNMWFKARNIEYIGSIAVNHSTWDLELENLSLESLILIYSDFCVKRVKEEGYYFNVKFLDLEAAFQIILDKLDNVDMTKENRYRRVYYKLKDFRDYVKALGVSLDVHERPENLETRLVAKSYSLMDKSEIIQHYKYQAIEHNINIMHMLRDEVSLNVLLEEARGQVDTKKLRRYIYVLEEYFTYLTPKQKLITLDFLFDSLIHVEEDIRKQCAELMGQLIASYDDRYKKEVPEDGTSNEFEYKQIDILSKYLNMFIYPDSKLTERKRKWIYYSLDTLVKSVTKSSSKIFKDELIELFHCYFKEKNKDKEIILLYIDVSEILIRENSQSALEYVIGHVKSKDDEVRLKAIYCLDQVIQDVKENLSFLKKITNLCFDKDSLEIYGVIAEDYIRIRMAGKLSKYGMTPELSQKLTSPFDLPPTQIYLDNLKAATPEVTKVIQIELLELNVIKSNADAFYTAIHFCNLLKVSRFEVVRNAAGEGLMSIYNFLSIEQKNDIVIELIRALEIEGFEYAKFIPRYLGRIIGSLSDREFLEIYFDLKDKVKGGSFQISTLILKTVGETLNGLMVVYDNGWTSNYQIRFEKLIGLILNGLVKQSDMTNQTAFEILGRDVIGNNNLNYEQRAKVFKRVCKKVMDIIRETKTDNLDFLSYASSLNYIYRFISEYEFSMGPFSFLTQKKVAVYLGTFDPFSIGQKEVARLIADSGIEVLIAIDEFKWNRRTQPNLIRRQIINETISNLVNVFQFPRGFSFNVKLKEDLDRLKSLLDNKEIYFIVGEDVLINQGAYEDKEGAIYDFAHIIIQRANLLNVDEQESLEDKIKNIKGTVLRSKIEEKFEKITCSQIRRNIDKEWDISDLVDPLTKTTIYKNKLYKSEPQYKEVVKLKEITTSYQAIDIKLVGEISNSFDIQVFDMENRFAYLIREKQNNKSIIGVCIYRYIYEADYFNELQSYEVISELKDKEVKKVLVIDFVGTKRNTEIINNEQVVLTETIVKAINEGAQYGVFKGLKATKINNKVGIALYKQGFCEKKTDYSGQTLFCVDFKEPCVLILDGTAGMKADYRNNTTIRKTIECSRIRLQKTITELYPGRLLLSFDRGMIYHHIISKILDINIKSQEEKSSQYGQYLCVPYGDIFKRWSLPHSVTKAFHTERYYSKTIEDYVIKAYPNYLSIDEQSQFIKSFNMPVILIDDLLDRGHRVRFIEDAFNKQDIRIERMVVAIMTQRAKEKFADKDEIIDAPYFIPKIRVWFNESDLYPFIGGDSVWYGEVPEEKLLPSINLMLPYVYPRYIKGVDQNKIYNLAQSCLENTINIIKAIEDEYLRINRRGLTLSSLGEVMITPRFPDHGAYVELNMSRKPTDFLSDDLVRLGKLKHLIEK